MRRGNRWPTLFLALALAALVGSPGFAHPAGDSGHPALTVAATPAQLASLFPQEAMVHFETLSTEDGLSQNAVLTICQDQQGFMWFGTEAGLNRYDGYQFRIYEHDPENPQTLSDNIVSTVYVDRSGQLWIGTRRGLDRFDPATETFVHYRHDPADPHSLAGTWVVSILEDQQGTLWIGTDDGGLNRMDGTTGTFTHYVRDPTDPHSLADNSIRVIHEDRSGNLWIGTRNGLDLLDRAKNTFVHYRRIPEDSRSLSDNAISAILEDTAGTLWIGTEGGGLDQLDQASGSFVHFQNDPADPHSLSHNRVRALFQDHLGRLWIGTQNGLNLLDRQSNHFVRFHHDVGDRRSLGADSIWSIFEDRTGVLWFGTYGGGLSKYSPYRNRFALFRHHPYRDSLSDDMVWSIHEDRQGMLWIGTFNGGLNRLDRNTDTYTVLQHDPADPTSISSNDVRAILEDSSGILWVGTNGGGLNRYDPATETFSHYRHDPRDLRSLAEDRVTALLEDRAGRLWVGTRTGGLNRLDRTTGRFVRYEHNPTDPFSLSNDRVWALHEDHTGAIWVGTLGGISVLDPATGRFTHYLHDPDDPNSLSNDAVFSLYEDPSGIVWVGTWGGGLDRLDPTTRAFTHYTKKDGLPDDVIYGLLADSAGYLWFSTNRGLSRFNPQTESFRNYDVSDGLQDNEFNVGAYYESRSGEMFFGGTKGFNAFYPEQVTDNPFIPPIVITNLSKLNQTVRTYLPADEHIQLSYRDNLFSFEFAALDYNAPEKNQYAYMVEGFDPDWVAAGNRRYASYTNLRGGDYVFRVKGSNNDGVWNEQGIAIHISVTPPFWETWWFLGLTALVLAGAVVAGYRLRVKSIETRSRALESQVLTRTQEIRRRTKELEALNAIATVVSRSLDLQEILNGALQTTLEVTGLEAGGIYLLHKDSQLLTITTHTGLSAEFVAKIDNLKVGEGLSGRVVQAGEPLVVSDLTADPRLTRPVIQESGFRSAAIVPLISRGEILGSLFVITREEHAFAPQEVDLLASTGHQIGVAIDNALLFEETQRRTKDLQALYRADEELYRHLDLDQVLETLVDVAVNMLQADKSSLLVWNAQQERLVVRAARGFRPETLAQMVFSKEEGTVGQVVADGEPIIVEDALDDPRVATRITAPEGIRSFMHVPIEIEGRIFGVFNVDYTQPRAFGQEEQRLFIALAQRAALAIENAHLYQAEQERLEESERRRQVAEGLRGILAVLNSNRPLDEVLNYIADQSCRLLSARASIVHHMEREKGQVLIEASSGLPDLEGRGQVTTKIFDSYADRAILNRRPYTIPDLHAHIAVLDTPAGSALDPGEREWRESFRRMEASDRPRAMLAVPLIVSDEVYGSIVFYYDQPRQFSEEDVQLGIALGDQAALAIENARLRAWAEEAAVAGERTRLARDLHDAVTQTLFSASLIAEVLPRLWERDAEIGRQRLEELRELTRGALAEMRTLLLELRPAQLEEAELADLLRQLAESVTGRARVPVTVNIEGQCLLPVEVKVALYRIAQEALNNVAKHAGASQATVTLVCRPGAVELRIRDDGSGFDPSMIPPDHLGVRIMHERAESTGAVLTIESTIGQGTQVTAVWAP